MSAITRSSILARRPAMTSAVFDVVKALTPRALVTGTLSMAPSVLKYTLALLVLINIRSFPLAWHGTSRIHVESRAHIQSLCMKQCASGLPQSAFTSSTGFCSSVFCSHPRRSERRDFRHGWTPSRPLAPTRSTSALLTTPGRRRMIATSTCISATRATRRCSTKLV
jgi:hypothetical protein